MKPYTTAMTLFAYALIFCALCALIATIAHVWNNYQERKFYDRHKLGIVKDAEKYLEPYDGEAALWTR